MILTYERCFDHFILICIESQIKDMNNLLQ